MYICLMKISDLNKVIHKTGLKKSFIATSIGIEVGYFARFFTSGDSRRPMPKHILAKLKLFLSKYN